jgi:uncharacterized membrane protein YcaP (DUF421 family)
MLLSIVRTIVIYAAVIFAMRLMGKRQLGELQPSELVTTFLVSNVASICIEEPELPVMSSLVPIFLICAMEILNSSLAWYFPRYAKLLFGKPITVIRDGEIDQHALEQMRISPADLLEGMRGKSVFTPAAVSWGVIETNGSLSLAERASDDHPMLPLMVEQHLYRENLSAFSLSEADVTAFLAGKGLVGRDVLILLFNGKDYLLVPKNKPAFQSK